MSGMVPDAEGRVRVTTECDRITAVEVVRVSVVNGFLGLGCAKPRCAGILGFSGKFDQKL